MALNCTLPKPEQLIPSTVPFSLLPEYCTMGSLFDLLQRAASTPEEEAQLTWERRLRMVGCGQGFCGGAAAPGRSPCAYNFLLSAK